MICATHTSLSSLLKNRSSLSGRLKYFVHVAFGPDMKQVNKKSKAASKKSKSARKEPSKKPQSASAQPPADGPTLATTEVPTNVRFSATIHVREGSDPNLIAQLHIDSVPDPAGLIRALVTPDDCVRLVNQGFEVRLDAAYPVKPLNPALIETKDSVQSWIDEKIQAAKRAK